MEDFVHKDKKPKDLKELNERYNRLVKQRKANLKISEASRLAITNKYADKNLTELHNFASQLLIPHKSNY